jgi:TrmH family RNA methyltransferase
MLSKNAKKFIKSLQLKKYRYQEQCFLVQGTKIVQELIQERWPIRLIASTQEFYDENSAILSNYDVSITSANDLASLGTFKSNDSVLVVAEMKNQSFSSWNENEIVIAFEDLRDPGNLGTILRTADWYGVRKVICSADSVDLYNPKVISSSMGSFMRISFHSGDLPEVLSDYPFKKYGLALGGTSIYDERPVEPALFVFGNESKGLSNKILELTDKNLEIPKFGSAESLNVAISTAITLDNIHRTR